MFQVSRMVMVATVSLSLTGGALAANQADRCEAGKLKVAGQYGSCRLNEESKAIKKGQGSTPDFARCQEKFTRKWEKTEGRLRIPSGHL